MNNTVNTLLGAAANFLLHDEQSHDSNLHRLQVGDQMLTRGQVASGLASEAQMMSDIQQGNAPPQDWMRIAVINEMKERLALPDGDEAAIGPWETLDELCRAAGTIPRNETLVADGRRFRRAISMIGAAFKHEELDDAGPHPSMVRLKALAEPIFDAMGDSDDLTVTFAGLPNIVRNLIDQLHAEGLAP